MTLWESWNMLIERAYYIQKIRAETEKEGFAVREIKAGEYYRHFKGGQYQVTAIARDANTEEKVVVYQALIRRRGLLGAPLRGVRKRSGQGEVSRRRADLAV